MQEAFVMFSERVGLPAVQLAGLSALLGFGFTMGLNVS